MPRSYLNHKKQKPRYVSPAFDLAGNPEHAEQAALHRRYVNGHTCQKPVRKEAPSC